MDDFEEKLDKALYNFYKPFVLSKLRDTEWLFNNVLGNLNEKELQKVVKTTRVKSGPFKGFKSFKDGFVSQYIVEKTIYEILEKRYPDNISTEIILDLTEKERMIATLKVYEKFCQLAQIV